MYNLFVILIVIAAVLMVGIVLIQESKGGGLASNFSSYNQIGGVRKTTDFVEKTTWGLAIAMVVLSVACAYVAPKAVTGESVLERQGIENTATNPNTLPGFGASQQKDAKQATDGATGAASKDAPAAAKDAPAAAPADANAAPKAPAKPAN